MYNNLHGDIIIYEEALTFDNYYDNNSNDYFNQTTFPQAANLDTNTFEPRFWFWRIIHNRYNNTFTLKRIELGVECTNVRTNVPFKTCLKIIYDRIVKYESYRLK